MEQKRTAWDLIAEFVSNDQVTNHAMRDVVIKNLDYGLGVEGAASGLRDLIQDMFYDGYLTMYAMLQAEAGPKVDGSRNVMEWTRSHITRKEFNSIDWVRMVEMTCDDLVSNAK